jgi:hypothetical protein
MSTLEYVFAVFVFVVLATMPALLAVPAWYLALKKEIVRKRDFIVASALISLGAVSAAVVCVLPFWLAREFLASQLQVDGYLVLANCVIFAYNIAPVLPAIVILVAPFVAPRWLANYWQANAETSKRV